MLFWRGFITREYNWPYYQKKIIPVCLTFQSLQNIIIIKEKLKYTQGVIKSRKSQDR